LDEPTIIGEKEIKDEMGEGCSTHGITITAPENRYHL
jgi:hypothetical protein